MRFPAVVLILLTVLLLGCKANSDPATATPTAEPAATTASAPESSPTPAATPVPCSPEAAALHTPVANEIEIRGSDEFKAWTAQALELIATRAPDAYREVTQSIKVIESVPAGSGMYVEELRYAVGDQTAYPDGYDTDDQLIWYAGTIVHDANHSALCQQGKPYSGKEAEVASLQAQKAALELLSDNPFFANYVQGLIDGADDPANQYWNQPNRHW